MNLKESQSHFSFFGVSHYARLSCGIFGNAQKDAETSRPAVFRLTKNVEIAKIMILEEVNPLDQVSRGLVWTPY